MLWYTCIFIAGLVALLVVAAIYKHFKAVATVRFYVAQGMTAFPSYNTFFFGDAKKIKDWKNKTNEIEAEQGRPLK